MFSDSVMHDVIVIGGGPAGSTASTLLAREGFRVTLFERERFPRFQIGESLLPYNNDVFRRLGVYEKLLDGGFFPKYGGEFVTADGTANKVFRFSENLEPPYRRAFQVERSRFDQILLDHSRENGVEVREGTAIARVDLSDKSRAVVETTSGERHEARFVVDCTGHGALLANATGRRENIASLQKTAIFSHYRNVAQIEGPDRFNTVVVVLRNGWFWLIPLSEDKTSVGLVIDRESVIESGLTPEELLERTIAMTPFVAERMKNAERTMEVRQRKDFSYRVSTLAGENFAVSGDAAGFLDPIFSTGVLIAMSSSSRLANAIAEKLRTGSMRGLLRYQRKTQTAIDRYLRFIENFYRRPFVEMLLHPNPPRTMFLAIVRLLGGNVFSSRFDRMMLAIFFSLVRLQDRFGFAPRIEWSALPGAARG
jgi:flavin-dependent dehydrogenase